MPRQPKPSITFPGPPSEAGIGPPGNTGPGAAQVAQSLQRLGSIIGEGLERDRIQRQNTAVRGALGEAQAAASDMKSMIQQSVDLEELRALDEDQVRKSIRASIDEMEDDEARAQAEETFALFEPVLVADIRQTAIGRIRDVSIAEEDAELSQYAQGADIEDFPVRRALGLQAIDDSQVRTEPEKQALRQEFDRAIIDNHIGNAFAVSPELGAEMVLGGQLVRELPPDRRLFWTQQARRVIAGDAQVIDQIVSSAGATEGLSGLNAAEIMGQLDSREESLEEAQAEYERMADTGVLSEAELELRMSAVSSARAGIDSMRESIQLGEESVLYGQSQADLSDPERMADEDLYLETALLPHLRALDPADPNQFAEAVMLSSNAIAHTGRVHPGLARWYEAQIRSGDTGRISMAKASYDRWKSFANRLAGAPGTGPRERGASQALTSPGLGFVTEFFDALDEKVKDLGPDLGPAVQSTLADLDATDRQSEEDLDTFIRARLGSGSQLSEVQADHRGELLQQFADFANSRFKKAGFERGLLDRFLHVQGASEGFPFIEENFSLGQEFLRHYEDVLRENSGRETDRTVNAAARRALQGMGVSNLDQDEGPRVVPHSIASIHGAAGEKALLEELKGRPEVDLTRIREVAQQHPGVPGGYKWEIQTWNQQETRFQTVLWDLDDGSSTTFWIPDENDLRRIQGFPTIQEEERRFRRSEADENALKSFRQVLPQMDDLPRESLRVIEEGGRFAAFRARRLILDHEQSSADLARSPFENISRGQRLLESEDRRSVHQAEAYAVRAFAQTRAHLERLEEKREATRRARIAAQDPWTKDYLDAKHRLMDTGAETTLKTLDSVDIQALRRPMRDPTDRKELFHRKKAVKRILDRLEQAPRPELLRFLELADRVAAGDGSLREAEMLGDDIITAFADGPTASRIQRVLRLLRAGVP